MSEASGSPLDLSDTTCKIVSAYVSNNHVAQSELPVLITTIHDALVSLMTSGEVVAEEPTEKQTPAQIRKSITPDALISFIDGKPYRTLKRHLSRHGFDPDSYRTQFGLPGEYPMVSQSYSEHRSKLAISLGFGSRNGRARGSNPNAGKKEQVKKA